MSPIIAVDVMGGDYGPSVTVPAVLEALNQHPDLKLVLVGNEELIRVALAAHRTGVDKRIVVHHASQQVGMDEPPSQALRNKKDSSMRVAINMVKDGKADACVSAGNTGALMATARYVLKTLPGIDRPAIVTTLPTSSGHTRVLDLGANVDTTAEQLVQFAIMGSIVAEASDNLKSATVGLLNIGQEDIKGNEQVKAAAKILQETPLVNYQGFVEGDDIYKGTVDVVVCDGFVGNVALKTSEGLAKMIAGFMKQEFQRNFLTKLVGLLAKPVLQGLKKRIDPRNYNGASLVGLQGIVIKSHGNADAVAFARAIHEAVVEIDKAVPDKIKTKVASLLAERQTS